MFSITPQQVMHVLETFANGHDSLRVKQDSLSSRAFSKPVSMEPWKRGAENPNIIIRLGDTRTACFHDTYRTIATECRIEVKGIYLVIILLNLGLP